MLQTLLPVITAFLGFGASFVLNIYSNKWNDKRLKLQMDHDLRKEKRKLMLEKGEELYLLLSKWSLKVSNYQHNILRVAAGKLTRMQVSELVLNDKDKDKFNVEMMLSILRIYYPQIKPAYDDVIKVRDKAVDIGFQHERGMITDSSCFNLVSDASNLFRDKMEVLLEILRNEIAKHMD